MSKNTAPSTPLIYSTELYFDRDSIKAGGKCPETADLVTSQRNTLGSNILLL